jgi:pyruvate carboxylase subunit B
MAPTTDHLAAIEKDTKRGIKATQAILEKEGLPVTDENLFIVASCEEKGVAFLKGHGTVGVRKNKPEAAAAAAPAPAAQKPAGAPVYSVTVNGQNFAVKLEGAIAVVNGTTYNIDVKEGAEAAPAPVAPAGSGEGTQVVSQLPGLVLRVEKPVGSPVNPGDSILVIESMKMETAMASPVKGVVAAINVKQGEQIQAGKVVAIVK